MYVMRYTTPILEAAAFVFLMEEQRTEDSSRRPDDRSYVFLLYPPSVGTTLNPDLYIVRVQLRALVVGLLVHQMLLHCIASVLLQGPDSSFPSLSNVIPPQSAASTSPKSIVPGYLPYLTNHHVDIFLSALDLSYATALKFDCRPGLKFLVQKVANLPQPANLYRQAGVAWTIKIVTLFELCLHEIEEARASLETVKTILTVASSPSEGNEQGEGPSFKKDPTLRKLSKHLRQLRTTFQELCESYVEIVLDEDGRHTKVDSFSERKIFLLVAQPDDFPEITGKESVMELRKSEENGSTVSGSSSNADLDLSPRIPPSRIVLGGREGGEDDLPKIFDNIDELLRDYERSKRGFRTNPFLRKSEDEACLESEEMANCTADESSSTAAFHRRSNVFKDSEAHRGAWAEMLSTVLDWTLALSDEQLVPLLPVFVSGVRVLTRYAVDQVLKQRLSTLFHRIAVLYGLTSN
ncbi:brefeldin A-inhibited guanine nucleotide-exchange protein 3-like [Apis dorsata]|uniref:brefeldin A-inhibited guanine nucleotide-exchange protein 3-like n=1 Tax=Apis dorsata TaxID=7462 RepID=UPI001292D267|nr:brefeldin A-inhibited guanine nucleotide-exchange protein 3-like [Apis dorsata]